MRLARPNGLPADKEATVQLPNNNLTTCKIVDGRDARIDGREAGTRQQVHRSHLFDMLYAPRGHHPICWRLYISS